MPPKQLRRFSDDRLVLEWPLLSGISRFSISFQNCCSVHVFERSNARFFDFDMGISVQSCLINWSTFPLQSHSFFSVDALFYDESGAPDFREDLTSEVALFHACEHLIGELEASTFSSRLPKALHYAEKVLVEANNLQSFHLPFPPPRLASSLIRFSSIQNVTTLQTVDLKALTSYRHLSRFSHLAVSIFVSGAPLPSPNQVSWLSSQLSSGR